MKQNLTKVLIGMMAIFAVSVFFGCKQTVTPNPDATTPQPAETPATGGSNSNNSSNDVPSKKPLEPPMPPLIPQADGDTNPSPTGSRYFDLNYIFNNQTLGKTTLKIRRSEWNQMLSNFDYFHKNENCVHGIEYTYEKDGYTWKVPNFGFRLRGATSRYRPQGKDKYKDAVGNVKDNSTWDEWAQYYPYAENCPDDDYRQTHFKVDFEEWLEGDEEFKMSNCMKGVALKRMDGSFTREIMCYDLFKKFGIWTAPRASHTRVLFEFVEDIDEEGNILEDISNCVVTNIDFGVYEMFEEVNKQSLKARDEDNNKLQYHENYWKNNKGNLWKCGGGDLTLENANFGIESNIIKFAADGKTPIDWEWTGKDFGYDLKTNKNDFENAKSELLGFIKELNSLPSDNIDAAAIAKIKTFYEKWFDVEFFLKTYAVNILCGMDDDYWGNANNYYLYFDTATPKATGKVYFIPFDYDNTLGSSIKGNGVADNPLEWGRGKNRPLMDKILLVPEYKAMFKRLLREVSSEDGPWNFKDCQEQFLNWKDMVQKFANSPDLEKSLGDNPKTSAKFWSDWVNKPNGYHLTSNPNLYDFTRTSFKNWTTDLDDYTFKLNGGTINGSGVDFIVKSPPLHENFSDLLKNPTRDGYIFAGWTKTDGGKDNKSETSEGLSTLYARWIPTSEIGSDAYIFEIEDDAYQGIKIGIINIPEDAAIRNVFVNDDLRCNLGLQDGKPNQYAKNIEWEYPYTEAGKTYKFEVQFQDVGYGDIGNKSNALSITATSGIGEFRLTNSPDWTFENNTITFSPTPEIMVGNRPAKPSDGSWSEYYSCEFATANKDGGWHNYESWNNVGAGNEIYVADKISDDENEKDDGYKYTKYEKEIMFNFWLNVADDINGTYRLTLFSYDWSGKRRFKLTK